jgi:hypothetical protein
MKMRILGNSLRLRLSMPEVADLKGDMHVSDSIDFGEQKLIYAVQGSDVVNIAAGFNGDFITVDVPRQDLISWADSDQVSLEGEMRLPSGKILNVLIEKDFACLTREGEEDKFPNPNAEC